MDDLIIEKKKNLGFVPEVVGYFASIEEFGYSYKYYNFRHPGAVFVIATRCVVEDFIELLQELEDGQNNYNKDDTKKFYALAKKFRILIHDFIKFYDSCAEIVIGCSKQHKNKPKVFLWRWLMDNKYGAADEMKEKTKDEIEVFRKINNKLKHTSNVIQPINFYNNRLSIMGFYMEGVDSEGGVGPDEEIHPRFHGQNTGISYNFLLKRLYYLLYKISDILKEVVINHFKEVYNLDLAFNNEYDKSSDKYWKKLYEMMNRLPNAYFPNEFRKEVYRFKEENNRLIFTKTLSDYTNLNGWEWDTYGWGDGFTRIYRIILYRSG